MRAPRPATSGVPARSCVYLVGAGPGDPDLLTVKALRLMTDADVVVYDRLVSEEIMQLIPAGVSRVFVGKQNGNHRMVQDEINTLLVRLARGGRKVVRLKGGDPFVFGRGGEEALFLARHHVRFEVVPGITAATACAAYAGIPLTHRDVSQGVVFVTGHGGAGKPLEAEIAEHYVANPRATLVVYMGMARIGAIMSALINRGMSDDTPVALIERGTTQTQRRLLTNVGDAPADALREDFRAPTLIVIGEVVRLAVDLEWFTPQARFPESADVAG